MSETLWGGDWQQTERGREGRCCFGQTEEGWVLMSSLTCNAVLGCITQSSRCFQWRGRGQRLTTAKESSRSDREGDRQGERESEQESRWACSRTLPHGSACSRASTFLLFLLSSLHSSSHLYSFCFATHLLYNLCVSLISSDRSLLLPSTFHSPSLFFFVFFSLLSDGVRRFFLTPPLVCPSPSTTSHGHPCILQVRASFHWVCVWAWPLQVFRVLQKSFKYPSSSSRWGSGYRRALKCLSNCSCSALREKLECLIITPYHLQSVGISCERTQFYLMRICLFIIFLLWRDCPFLTSTMQPFNLFFCSLVTKNCDFGNQPIFRSSPATKGARVSFLFIDFGSKKAV